MLKAMVNKDDSQWEYWFGHANLGRGLGISDMVNLSGSMSGVVYSDGYYQRMQTGSSAGNAATCVGMNTTPSATANNVFFDQDFDITLVIVTGTLDPIRLWFVLLDQDSTMGNNDAFPSSASVIGFRYSSNAGDNGWTGFCQDGVNTSTVTAATIQASTKYVLRIRKVGGTAYFSAEGQDEQSISTNVPTGNTPAQLSLEVYTTVGGNVRLVDVGRVGCSIG
jgi:hypothetical protein